MDEHTQRLIDIYAFMKAALELCEVDVIQRQQASGDAEIWAIVKAMSEDWGECWGRFRQKWDIPDHPLTDEILEVSAEVARREQEQLGEQS
jgi:hypothetical protein